MLIGDFNACVGSRNKEDEWWDERGPHGLGVLNDAGRELLSFCSINGATVCKHMVPEERDPQTDLATPKVKAVALH